MREVEGGTKECILRESPFPIESAWHLNMGIVILPCRHVYQLDHLDLSSTIRMIKLIMA